MPTLSGSWLSDQFIWHRQRNGEDEFSINLHFVGKLTKRAALKKIQKRMQEGVLPWLSYEKKMWKVDFDCLRSEWGKPEFHTWWKGKIPVEVDVEETKGDMPGTVQTMVSLVLTHDDVQAHQHAKIFLSHKGEDKKMVRRFLRVLEVIGYEVWMDEKNLKAGDHLERGIRQGFEESGAAIFFITENFKDEQYLKAEIDYAIAQKRVREDDFRIITLAFKKGRQKLDIPPMLKNYVWKSPATELDALVEIIKALPPPAKGNR